MFAWLIDNYRLLHDGVRTQIKRAYESGVCLFLTVPNIASAGVLAGFGAILDGLRRWEVSSGVRCVQFSFHCVEIS